MRKVFALLLVMLACFTAFLAAETTELKLKVCRNDGQDYECLLSNVDNVKFIIGAKEIEDEADSRDYIDAGALTAASYKVSDSTSVFFSQGNLQFNAMMGTHQTADGTAQGTWRFAEKQYDVVGYANENIDSTYFGWIDLFGAGTSGCDGFAPCYQPWSNSMSKTSYYVDLLSEEWRTRVLDNMDWGVYNAISNGGDMPNKWRTLTSTEWEYLLQNNKWTLGCIETSEKNSILCLMLVPKEFIEPEGVTVTVLSTSTTWTSRIPWLEDSVQISVPSTNTYSTEEFASIEKLGVVAFPCGGYRYGMSVGKVGSVGYYRPFDPVEFVFYSTYEFSCRFDCCGGSVRLVQDGADIHFVNADGTTLLDTVVARGVIPTYTREKPTMDSKAYTFEFKGWNKKVVAAECDMVYTAVYDSFPMLYTSVFKDYDGTTIKTIEKCTYDSVLAETPTRGSIQDYDYEFLEWKSDESKISERQLVYTAVYGVKYTGEKLGVIPVAYKVSDSTSVYFSRGNLQYCAGNGTVHKTADGTFAQGTWRFAENQWDVVGKGNKNIDSTYTGWIDLFGWGTSGWDSKAQPWSKSGYYPDVSPSNGLTGTCANADWGVYNAISNGGDEPNKWRTLTTSEWQYLFKNNKWTFGYIKTTEKDSSLCFMLIPDGFTAPTGVKVTVISTNRLLFSGYVIGISECSYVGNSYTTEQFTSLEKLGVVALPCGKCRVDTSIPQYTYLQPSGVAVSPYGGYWSSSRCSYGAYRFDFDSTLVDSEADSPRFVGMSVRLVQGLTSDIHFVNADGTTLLDTTVLRGVTPTYTREVPTMGSTKTSTYVFKGWDKKIVAAECDMVYTAVYDTFPVLYTSVFKDYDGTPIETVEKCTYDSVLSETPTRESIIQDYDYEFLEWKRDESKISDKQLVYTAVYGMKYTGEKSGTIQAAYKVSDTKSVYFSRGNLQYCAGNGTGHKTADGTIAQGTWRFAENQYDVIGEENENIDSTYTGWIDLFGWGTSGWNSEAICYQPWSKSSNGYYQEINLKGVRANADWGVYNAISNGSNEPNKWRTLTDSEWEYLIKNNKWTLGYIKTTEKDSSLCFLLIPETFTAPEEMTVEVLDTAGLNFIPGDDLTIPSTNKYSTEQFASLEQLGVVALPCGGFRGFCSFGDGTSVGDVGSGGRYWSSSATVGSYVAYGFLFDSTYVCFSYDNCRNLGSSVRLVQDVP